MKRRKELAVGCYSDDPDHDKHNWPEYTHNEDGDQALTCKCGVDYFGYLHRETCYACRTESGYSKITAIAATLNEFDHMNGRFAFTKEQLHQLAETAAGVKISDNFDHRAPAQGKVIEARVENDRLVVDIDMFIGVPDDEIYLVPGYKVPEFESKTHALESFEYGLTYTPADKSLPPIKSCNNL